MNSRSYHLPQNRQRAARPGVDSNRIWRHEVYIVGVHERAKLLVPMTEWTRIIKEELVRHSALPAHAFLLDDEEPEVQEELDRGMTSLPKHLERWPWKGRLDPSK